MQLADHFRNKERRLAENVSQRRWFIKARQDQAKRDAIEDRLEGDALAFAAETVAATQIQIEAFEVKLDAYDEATIVALMENQEALDLVRAEIQNMLDRAYVMEDGRRVFKTEDGTQVFDEFGEEVSREQLNFDRIPDTNPTWEAFSALDDERAELLKERQQILEFQEKLDAAREDISRDGITQEQLEEMDADLLDAMPPAVARQSPGYEPAAPTPDATAVFKASANPLTAQNAPGVSTAPQPETM